MSSLSERLYAQEPKKHLKQKTKKGKGYKQRIQEHREMLLGKLPQLIMANYPIRILQAIINPFPTLADDIVVENVYDKYDGEVTETYEED